MMQQSQKSINDLLLGLDAEISPAYQDKMIHKLPDAEVVDRMVFILRKSLDRMVLDVGCAGVFHLQIQEVAKKCYGWDHTLCKTPNFQLVDLEGEWVVPEEVNLIICGEVVEHLSNPGIFLSKLSKSKVEKIFTIPNAFAKWHRWWVKRGEENVNSDHVAWYSWYTFSNLLKRYDYKVREFYWWDNPDRIQEQGLNEGLIFVTD